MDAGGVFIGLLLVVFLIAATVLIAYTVSRTHHEGQTGSIRAMGPTGPPGNGTFAATQVLYLASSTTGEAPITDHNLVGTWGIAMDFPTTTANTVEFWLTRNGNDVQTGSVSKNRYSWSLNTGATGIDPLITASVETLSILDKVTNPSGVVTNLSPTAFPVASAGVTGPAKVIVVSEAGTIYAHNPLVAPGLIVVQTGAAGANYKGCDILNDQLYVANWGTARVDVFDSSYALVNSFTDPDSDLVNADGYSVFNVAAIEGQIFMSLAYSDGQSQPIPGVGNGYISVFNADGTFVRRFVSRGALNSPWSMTFLPGVASSNGRAEVIVGNNGDGTAHIFLYGNGLQQSAAVDQFNNPINLDNVFGIVPTPFTSPFQTLFCGSVAQRNEGILGVAVSGSPPLNPELPFPGT